MDIIKNLNYSANEINDILALVGTRASDADLSVVRDDLSKLSGLFYDHAKRKTTLVEYEIADAKIENGVITLGEQLIEPATKEDLNTLKLELVTLINSIKNQMDINNAPDKALTDSDGNVFTLEDGKYFITK